MEDLIALRARQLAYIRDYNARLRAAATARNRAAWDAFFAANPDPEALCKPAALDPHQPWPATAAGYNGPDACEVAQ